MKKTFYTEVAYFLGLIILAIGTALMEKADFGLSMVVAPAYIIHLKVSEFLPFFSFGMGCYTFQAILLLLMICILRKFKGSYLFSFCTAVLYGCILDCAVLAFSSVTVNSILVRIILFSAGLVICTIGIAFIFHTYIAPEVYELFVKELTIKTGAKLSTVKIFYDCGSLILAIILSFVFFGFGTFKGIEIGTVISTLLNGPLIGYFASLFKRTWKFRDGLNLRKYFS